MKLYAERPARLIAQFVGDLLLVAWSLGWIWLGQMVHDRIDALRGPVFRVGRASEDLARSVSGTGDQVRNLQVVGDVLAQPFDAIVNGAQELVRASNGGQASIARLADLAVPVVAVFPVLFALTVWLALRGRWIRRASAAARARRAGNAEVVLAAQALTSGRVDRLVELVSSDDPMSTPDDRRALAAHQLHRLGLKDRRR